MLEARLRTKVSEEEMEQKVGKILTPQDSNLRLTGPAKILLPDGRPLCIYLPGALTTDPYYADLHTIRMPTDNRGLASGTLRIKEGTTRTRSKNVTSAIIGAKEAQAPFTYCRLTAWNADHVDQWTALQPLFQEISYLFGTHVPDRFSAQVKVARETNPAWMIKGTPFTTITVNNTYPTGVHTDKGDLDEGFSCLAVLRRGRYDGGYLTFPEYRVSVDMQDGDLLLMDAHQWHGNTPLKCHWCDALLDKFGHECVDSSANYVVPERISIVCYFRTKMVKCGSPEEEQERATATAAKRTGL
jgi:hypothetical protein